MQTASTYMHKHSHAHAHTNSHTTHKHTHTPGTWMLARLCKLPALLPRRRGCCVCRYNFSKSQLHSHFIWYIEYQNDFSEFQYWRDFANCQHCCHTTEDAASAGTNSQKSALQTFYIVHWVAKWHCENFYPPPTMSCCYSAYHIKSL